MEKNKDSGKKATSVAHVDTDKNMTAGTTAAQSNALNNFKSAQEATEHHKQKAEEMHKQADDLALKAELAKQKAEEAKAKLEKVNQIMDKKKKEREEEDL